MSRFQEWARHEYNLRQRLIILIPAGVLFVLILPFAIFISSNAIDQRLQLPKFTAGWLNLGVGLLLVKGGLYLALWSIQAQVTIGRGTPVPVMPTQKLIVKAPFAYCRNPMALGTFLAYLGISVGIGSLSAVAIVLILMGMLLLYIKRIEEKELEARFGREYLEYKRSTPFILPRWRPRS